MQSREARQVQDFRAVGIVVGVLIIVGVITVSLQSGESWTTAVLWSFASLLTGVLFGFLFGIPRVLQGNAPSEPQAPSSEKSNVSETNAQALYRLQVNTNLEQISDWLTKIIVGIGLVELRRIPELATSLALFVAQGLGGGQNSEVFAMALLIYFSVLGFLGGYLITRIYLAGAFSRADLEAQTTVTFAGRDVSIEQVSKELSSQIADIRDQFLKSSTIGDSGSAAPVAASGESVTASKVTSILWVDDTPSNNSVLIEQLTAMGIMTVTSPSTADALQKLQSRRFDRIISDMGRQEGARSRFNETAGIDLIRAVRANDTQTPIIIYCSVRKAAEYRDAALEAGANAITASPTILLKELNLGV